MCNVSIFLEDIRKFKILMHEALFILATAYILDLSNLSPVRIGALFTFQILYSHDFQGKCHQPPTLFTDLIFYISCKNSLLFLM